MNKKLKLEQRNQELILLRKNLVSVSINKRFFSQNSYGILKGQ